MLTGYNTDFKFQGKVFHCQTEDGGVNSPNIISLLYFQGAILASRKTSYADILKADCLDEVVRELMMEQHKQMIRDLMQGKLNLNNAPHEAAYESPADKAAAAAKEEAAAEAAASAAAPAPAAPVAAAPAPEPAPAPKAAAPPPPPPPPQKEPAEKSLDDIILDFLAQEQKERKK